MKKQLKIIAGLALVVLLVTASLSKMIVADYFKRLAEEEGLEVLNLHIKSLGPGLLAANDISLGPNHSLQAKEAEITYSLSDLWHDRVASIKLKNMLVEAKTDANGKLFIKDLGPLLKASPTSRGNNLLLPNSVMSAHGFFFDALSIEDSKIHITGEDTDITVPFSMLLETGGVPRLRVSGLEFNGHYAGYSFTSSPLSVELRLDENKGEWSGAWRAVSFAFSKGSDTIPPLKGEGKISASQSRFALECKITNALPTAPHQISIDSLLTMQMNKSALKVRSASIEMGEGRIGAKNVMIPLQNALLAVHIPIAVSQVPLNDILNLVTQGKAHGTGTISGTLPIALLEDGNILFYPGRLKAGEAGTITIPPELIPSTNEDVSMLKKVLGNFHYDAFTMDLKSAEGDNIDIDMYLSGNNPNAYKGRAVKLHVHLTGDLLKVLKSFYKIPTEATPEESPAT